MQLLYGYILRRVRVRAGLGGYRGALVAPDVQVPSL